jgi:tetratricopeptide (TPR) repeat protein
LLIFEFLVVFPAASALAKTPVDAYKRITEFTQKGDWEAFYDSFDSDSQKVNLSSLSFMSFAAFGDGECPAGFASMSPREKMIAIYRKKSENPERGNFLAREVVSSKVSGDRATLIVRRPAGEDKEVLMKLENGDYKIHLKEADENPGLVRLGAAVEKNDEKAAETELNRIMARERGEDPQDDSDLTTAVEVNPGDPDSYYMRGRAYLGAKDFDKAIADLDEAIRLNRDFADAYNKRGVAYAMKQDYGRAFLDFDKAIKINPEFANAYTSMGNAYSAQGKTDQAIEEYSKAIKIDPKKNGDAYYGRGVIYFNRGNTYAPIPDLLNALVLNPGRPGLNNLLVSIGKPALPYLQEKLEEVKKESVDRSKAISALNGILRSLEY